VPYVSSEGTFGTTVVNVVSDVCNIKNKNAASHWGGTASCLASNLWQALPNALLKKGLFNL
jgi:hypothetical protein